MVADTTIKTRASRRQAAGLSVVELIVTLVILSAAIVGATQAIVLVSRQQELVERRSLAQQEAANVMERAFARPLQELTAEELAKLQVSAQCRERLPEVALRVALAAASDASAGRPLTVEIDWREPHGGRTQPVRLTAWRFSAAEEQP